MTLLNVLAMSLAEIFGNANFKNFVGSDGHHGHLVGGFVGYLGVMYFLIQSFASTSMLVTTFMWEGMITVLGSAYAFIVLGERFTSWIQYVGVVLAILSVWMVHCGDCK
jgi:multidrug transporter EmrE-like cation transporter